MSDHNPTMFCHDGTTIYYPTAPGRVYTIVIFSLWDCDGSDDDFSDSTSTGDVHDMLSGLSLVGMASGDTISSESSPPSAWPLVYNDDGDVDHESTAQDFHDALGQWADWCDRDSERLDALDNLGPVPVVVEMSLAEAVSCSQPAVAI